MREDDPELVIQPVEEQPQRRGFLTGVGRVHESKPHHDASGDAIVPDVVASPAAVSDRRQSESSKIRTAPPAVRTYCTLPADIQL